MYPTHWFSKAHIAVRVLDGPVGAPGAARGPRGRLRTQAAALPGRPLPVQLGLQLQRVRLVRHLHCSAEPPAQMECNQTVPSF